MLVDYFPVCLVITDAIRERESGKKKSESVWETTRKRVDKRVRMNRT